MVSNVISYELHKGNIRVRLGRKIVGVIRKIKDGSGYHYKPNGGKPGETFATVAEVKASIEAP